MCPSDPGVCNELGVLAFRSRQYDTAAQWFRIALACVPSHQSAGGWYPGLGWGGGGSWVGSMRG